jgi:hypothetical protein
MVVHGRAKETCIVHETETLMAASTSLLPHQVMTGIGPSSDDVSWLNAEGDSLSNLSNSVSWVSGEIADAKANPQTGPSLSAPSHVLEQLTSAASIAQIRSDAARLKMIASKMGNLLTQTVSQAQQITSLQQQLATGGSPATLQTGGSSVKGGTPTKTTTTTTTVPASGVGTGTVVAGIAALAALGAGAWWYTQEQKKKQGLPLKRRP